MLYQFFALKKQQQPGFLFLSCNSIKYYFCPNFINQTKTCHSHIPLHFVYLYLNKFDYIYFIFTVILFTVTIRPRLCGNCAFRQNSYTRKLGEMTVFYAVNYYPLNRKEILRKLRRRISQVGLTQEEQQPNPSRQQNNLSESLNDESSDEEENDGTICKIFKIP